MKIADLFETKVAEKIEPVIKVGETGDERKLASEIGSYVITPMIEKVLDDFLEHYTDTFLSKTTEIGVWISGYFGSGKSHLAKIMALLAENRKLVGVEACNRFTARIPPDSLLGGSINRSLSRMNQCDTRVLAFNLNTITDSKSRPLPGILLSQYYYSLGYGTNLIYARVIEAELDKQGKLKDLHAAVESSAEKPWADIQRNLSFYRNHLYQAACQVAPNVFASTDEVDKALKEAQSGELYNVDFLIRTILDDLEIRKKEAKKPQRLMLVLDESGQWIGDDGNRLAQLQALIEEAAIKGQGKIWIVVTTHGDIGSIFKEARALAGDMKKIEGRFRFKPALTTENIELVLEDRLFKKKLSGKQILDELYDTRGGVLRGLGELANTSQTLPACTQEKFSVYYPFFPYQIHLVPEIVKSLRSKGGRGEQMTGSTRTLLAISQDILSAGRRNYLDEGVGSLVSFDEIYHNLVGEGEISPDVRTELSRLKEVVPDATTLTPRVAEVLYLIRELPYIPRTKDNIARLLLESADEELPSVLSRIEPELERLISAKLVARIGEEYEFLTGERRTFEEEVSTVEMQFKQQERERGLEQHYIHEPGKSHWRNWLGFDSVGYKGIDFQFPLQIDGTLVPGRSGDIKVKLVTPLGVLGSTDLAELENSSLRSDEQNTIFFMLGRIPGFDRDLTRYLSMKEIIDNWKGDPHKAEEARKLAQDRETNDLPKLHRKVVDGLKAGIKSGHVIFRGASRALVQKPGQTPGESLRAELAAYWPVLYPKFDKVPVRVTNEQKAIFDVLSGALTPSADIKTLKLYDKSGKIELNAPLLDAIRIFLSTEQNKGRRVLGDHLIRHFSSPPYGWDGNALRVGVAALVRSASVKILIGKKPYTNPKDKELIDALRVSRSFNKVELVLEEVDLDPDILTEARKFIIKIAKTRNVDETPASISEVAGKLADTIATQAETVNLWVAGSGMPLSDDFIEGVDAWRKVQSLTNPVHRVKEIHGAQSQLQAGYESINVHSKFRSENGILFTEMTNLLTQLEGIEHHINQDNPIRLFLDEYRTAKASASFIDKEVWKSLQSLKSQSILEMTPVLDSWRIEARTLLQEALDRLADDLTANGLDHALEPELAEPLESLLNQLDTILLPVQVAALPDRGRAVIRYLGQRISEEIAKKDDKPKPEPKKIRYIRLSDISTVTRVNSREEWESLREKLDRKILKMLDEGYEVELR